MNSLIPFIPFDLNRMNDQQMALASRCLRLMTLAHNKRRKVDYGTAGVVRHLQPCYMTIRGAENIIRQVASRLVDRSPEKSECKLLKVLWWRRRELNPRPRKPAMKSLRAYPIQNFRAPLQNRQERRRPSPIDLDLLLRTEALGLSCKMTLTHRRTGSPAGAAT
jgi:hypothetical protein